MSDTPKSPNGYKPDEIFVAATLAREDFYFFTRWMFLRHRGYKWRHGMHHLLICDALMRVYRGECKRLIINIPPRYSKTELAVINFMAWATGHNPDAEFIHTSYSGRLAASNSWKTRELVQSVDYQTIFPGVVLRNDSTAKDEWRTVQGGCVYAVGAMGTITGYGAGKDRPGFGGAIIIDDPHKADEANSDTVRNGVLDWFQNTLESRKNAPETTPIILIMQRLHEKDLAGWLIDGGNGEQWEQVVIPAINDAGEALWPEKHDIETLRRMQAASPYVFSGQYMQRPSPLGGGIIKTEWFKRYAVLPPFFTSITMYGDTAQKTGEKNDYSVFELWGKAPTGLYLIDMIRGKWEAPELKTQCIDFWNKHKAKGVRALVIEDKASGTGLIQDIKRAGNIPVLAMQRVKDKLTRVMDVVSYIASGYIFLPENAPFVSDFITECEKFTPDDTHDHDDQIDPMCDAIAEAYNVTGSSAVFEYFKQQFESQQRDRIAVELAKR